MRVVAAVSLKGCNKGRARVNQSGRYMDGSDKRGRESCGDGKIGVVIKVEIDGEQQ
jgi:hypothetical protein